MIKNVLSSNSKIIQYIYLLIIFLIIYLAKQLTNLLFWLIKLIYILYKCI